MAETKIVSAPNAKWKEETIVACKAAISKSGEFADTIKSIPAGYPVKLTKTGAVVYPASTSQTNCTTLAVLGEDWDMSASTARIIVSGDVYVQAVRDAGVSATDFATLALHAACGKINFIEEKEAKLYE